MAFRPSISAAFRRLLCVLAIVVGLAAIGDSAGVAAADASLATIVASAVSATDVDDSAGTPDSSIVEPAPATSTDNQLPETGVSCDLLALIGAALVVLGLALVGVGGRRRPHSLSV